jgi:glycerophosphoryl diester phosphodiesterase
LRLHPYLEFAGPIAFAHRGGALEAPENTMRAFAAAVAQGYTYLETDAQATADGVLLAFHDDVLDRVTDKRGAIAELNYGDVQGARVAGTEPIPRLADVLTAWPDVRVNIDLKSDGVIAPMKKLLKELDCLDRVCVGSFSRRPVGAMRAEFGAKLCTSLGPWEVGRLKLAALGLPCGPIGGNCAQVPETWPIGGLPLRLVDERFLAAAHRRNIPVHLWTIDERPDMERLLDLGVDGLMTDRPALLKKILEERAQWRVTSH